MGQHLFVFHLPDIGEGVVEGEVVEWLKEPGDLVDKDEAVVVVMTDKATVELPSPYAGKMAKHYYKAGETAIKDKPLYALEVDDFEEGNRGFKSKERAPESAEIGDAGPLKVEGRAGFSLSAESHSDVPGKGCLALPRVRHLAKELGIDLAGVKGSGKGGRIEREDLAAFIKQGAEVAGDKKLRDEVDKAKQAGMVSRDGDERLSLTGVRALMAKKMGQQLLPQFSYGAQVEVSRLIQLRRNLKEKAALEGLHLTYMPFFIRALSLAMRQYPELNSSLDVPALELILHSSHNIGIAIASPQGLIVPVLKGVQDMDLKQIIEAYEALKDKALVNKLMPKEMKEATITISNFGVLGDGLWATPMVTPPQVAILAVGRLYRGPIVKNDQLLVGDLLPISWSFDHRIIDGEKAAIISHAFSALLRDPAALL